MMALERSKCFRHALLVLFVLIGIPSAAHSQNLEDSARELARKIGAALPAGQNVATEIRNNSSLQPGDVAHVEQALKIELQERGLGLSATGDAATVVVVTLSENFKELLWTGEIRQGDISRVVMVAFDGFAQNRITQSTMPVSIRAEKFWTGPQHILDAGEASDVGGMSWLVLLLPDKIEVHEPHGILAIDFLPVVSRDPQGNLDFGRDGKFVGLFVAPQMCRVDLDRRQLSGCARTDGPETPLGGRSMPVMIDLAPAGPPQPGKGTEIAMGAVCGGVNQFLATDGRDYTQTDSLQVFEGTSGGAVAISAELNFPGPITALHAVSGTPRAIVRNLTTGNYEAYRLSFSCAH
jgi:hypothetical protein